MSSIIRIANGKLIIELDIITNPTRTKGGEGSNLMVATTGGYAVSDVQIGGKTVKVSVNAIVKA